MSQSLHSRKQPARPRIGDQEHTHTLSFSNASLRRRTPSAAYDPLRRLLFLLVTQPQPAADVGSPAHAPGFAARERGESGQRHAALEHGRARRARGGREHARTGERLMRIKESRAEAERRRGCATQRLVLVQVSLATRYSHHSTL
jgi:hypothetical protein